MRGLHKSKRVSWATDGNLCQVKLFLSDESPSQVGLGAQDQLQAKASWLLHSTGMGSDDNLPPGFEAVHTANQLQINFSQIPRIKWSNPPRIFLDSTWQVVAGEESKEVEDLNRREMRVLEAVYPRASSIPPNPSFPVEIENICNDQETPVIPITPIEDEDASADMPSDTSFNITCCSDPPLLPPGIPSPSHISNRLVSEKSATGMVPGVEPDILAAASMALSGIVKNNEQGNLIDHELLIKILSNPQLIEKLVTDNGTSTSTQNAPMPRSISTQTAPIPRPHPISLSTTPPLQFNQGEISTPPPATATTSTGPFCHRPNGVGVVSPNAPNPHALHGVVPVTNQHSAVPRPVRDINYYKSLIEKHGGERQELPHLQPQPQLQQFINHHNPYLGANQEPSNTLRQRDLKPKIMKPCIYFNSSRGCRHGANCAYRHDESYQQQGSSMPDVPGAKRMKMDREITGT